MLLPRVNRNALVSAASIMALFTNYIFCTGADSKFLLGDKAIDIC